ncbi:WD40 repeat domain-containing protein [Micromonospora craniellae]|nr:WD40 repeat domain-containing protein [Micromonospora craniellae]QOC94252.1 WD40 repeat domain-containing protein [Micromonospora craniellae]
MYLNSPDRRLTAEGYRQVGGIDGAVAATADRVYNELTREQQDLARCLFLDLVHVTIDAVDTRRRVPVEHLIGGADAIVQQQVLDRFVTQRIITVDTGTVEISHEAVLTAWPQLRGWLDSDRAGHMVGQQLVADAAAWRDHPDPSALYQGSRLAAAQEWIADRRRRVPSATTEFVAASLQYGRRLTRRLQRTIAALAAMLVLVAGLSVFAFVQRGEALALRHAANQQRDQAQSRAIAVRSADLRTKDPTAARQLAVAAYRAAPTVESRSALLDASAMRAATRLRGSDSDGIMYAAAFDPTGRVLAASTETGVRLWSLDGDHPTRLVTLPSGSDAKIYNVAFSHDGRLLAAAGADARIRLWNTAEPAAPVAVDPLTGFDGRVYSLAFTADGALLAAATSGGDVHLFVRDEAGQFIPAGSPLTVSTQAAKSVVFRDPTTLVVGSADGKVTLWNVATPASPVRTATLAGPTKEIGQVAASPNGRLVAAGSADTNAYLWASTGPPAATVLAGVSSWINSVAFSPDNASLAVASSDAESGVRVFDVATGTVTATLPHPVPVTAVKFAPDGKTIVTTANDGYARLWPIAAPTLELPGTVSATRFSPDRRLLAVGSDDTRLYDVADPDHPALLGPGLSNPDSFNSALAFTPDSRTLATGHGRSGTIRLWDVTDPSRPKARGVPITAHNHQIEALNFNPDGRVLATGSRDTFVKLWDTADPARITLLATLTGFTGTVFSVAFSSDGRYLAAANSDKTVRVWDVTDPRKVTPVGGPIAAANHYIYSVAFSPDGRMLASGSADRTVRLWDVTTIDHPVPINPPLRGPTNYVYQVAFSSDGTTLVAAITDATVWMWDVRTRERIATLTLPNDAVYTTDVHPDRHTVVAGGADQRVYLWTTDPERAAVRICETVGDPITAEEWATYIPDRPYAPPCR